MKHLLWLWLLLLPPWALAGTLTPSELQSEITTNPTSLSCYASNVTAGNDAAIVACINQVRSGGDYVVSQGIVTRNVFIGVWGDVIQLIPSITDATVRSKWTWMVQTMLGFVDTIDYASPTAAGFFAQMVSDGLQGAGGTITTNEVTARTTRQGSRAEVLKGPGTMVTIKDVSCALRGACL